MNDDIMQTQLDTIQTMLGEFVLSVGERFDAVDERFRLLENRVDQKFALMNERMDSHDVRFSTIDRTLGKMQITLADIEDDLASTSHAVDADSVTIIDHERRIQAIEHAA